IVFTDMNINNHGGRIPQISAEITKAAAPNVPSYVLQPFSGVPNLPAIQGPMAVDLERGVAYARSNGGAGYNVYSLDTMGQIGVIDGAGGTTASLLFPGLACIPGGTLYDFAAGPNRLNSYDPDTFQSISTYFFPTFTLGFFLPSVTQIIPVTVSGQS